MKTIIALFLVTAFSHTFLQAHAVAESSFTMLLNKNSSETLSSNNADELTPFNIVPPIAVNSRSTVMQLKQATVFVDSVGAQIDYRRFGSPDIVVLTRAAPSHLNIDTMIGMLRRNTIVLAPQAVIDQLSLMIANNVITPFDAGTTQQVRDIVFRALDRSEKMPADVYMQERERGDIGVVMEVDGESIYF